MPPSAFYQAKLSQGNIYIYLEKIYKLIIIIQLDYIQLKVSVICYTSLGSHFLILFIFLK